MFAKRSLRLAVSGLTAVACMGSLVGASSAAAKTKASTFSQCLSTAIQLPDRRATAESPGVTAVLPVSVPKFKGKRQDGTVTALSAVGVRTSGTFAGDLLLQLISPGGQVVTLSNARGGEADGYGTGPASCAGALVTFADGATVSAFNFPTVGDTPLSGTVRPEGPLAALVGAPARGNWVLAATDTSSSDLETLNAFSLNFSYVYKLNPKKKK